MRNCCKCSNKIISNLDPVLALAVLIIPIRGYKQASMGNDVHGLYCICVPVFKTKICELMANKQVSGNLI